MNVRIKISYCQESILFKKLLFKKLLFKNLYLL